MRKPYPTDLSDAEWACIEPHLPTPKAPGRPRVHSLREILDAIFYISISCVADVPGACYRTNFRLGRLSITTSGFGASMAPGSDYTLPYAIVCEFASKEILNRARA
jgi:Putative transposase of IS4/5 family (DUF4096)